MTWMKRERRTAFSVLGSLCKYCLPKWTRYKVASRSKDCVLDQRSMLRLLQPMTPGLMAKISGSLEPGPDSVLQQRKR